MSNMPSRVSPLRNSIARLSESVITGTDPDRAQALLEEQRPAIREEAIAVERVRDDFNRELCEYDAVQGFTPVINRHSLCMMFVLEVEIST
jgi:hypothetical protein